MIQFKSAELDARIGRDLELFQTPPTYRNAPLNKFLHTYVFSLTSRLFTYSSVRKLVKLSAVQFMLNNHTVSTSLTRHIVGLLEM